jgi:hypothetical protein
VNMNALIEALKHKQARRGRPRALRPSPVKKEAWIAIVFRSPTRKVMSYRPLSRTTYPFVVNARARLTA